jgi:hypothetical protein
MPPGIRRCVLTLLVGGVLSLLLMGALLYAAALWFFGGSGSFITGPCGEERLLEKTSPDKRYVATVFRRNCGATTDFVLHVNLRPQRASFRVDGSGTITEGCVFLSNHEPRLILDWERGQHLVIRSDFNEASVKKHTWRDVTVSYEPAPR